MIMVNASNGSSPKAQKVVAYRSGSMVNLSLRTGVYHVTTRHGTCGGEANVAILDGHVRPVSIQEFQIAGRILFSNDAYKVVGAALVGELPMDGLAVEVSDAQARRLPPPSVIGSAYYFDSIPDGKYTVSVFGENWSSEKTVTISHSRPIWTLNFALPPPRAGGYLPPTPRGPVPFH